MTHPDVRLVVRAADFAARRHVSQRRKGVARDPYINHLIEVAGLLAEATRGDDAALIAAGLLHDTLEDTPTKYEELETLFGGDVATLVAEVTDDKSLPKAERKRLQIETAASKSPRGRLLKIADKTSNVRALASSPPDGWEVARVIEYVDWAENVVARRRSDRRACRHRDTCSMRRQTMIPGELLIREGEITINADRKTVTLTIINSGDRPIQVGSHYHFFETNPALKFDRKKARGMRLDIAAGTAVRFEPGQKRDVTLVAMAGKRTVYGFRQDIMGKL